MTAVNMESSAPESLEISELLAMAGAGSCSLFAIVDACDDALALDRVLEMGDSAMSLYQGSAAEDFSAIAPYLVPVDREMLQWISDNMAGKPWGVLLMSSSDINVVRRHLRKFLIVRSPDDKELYFRFYDPRVLPGFLKSCTQKETLDFYGPIARFLISSSDRPTSYEILQHCPQ
jgi:hypothetical protein